LLGINEEKKQIYCGLVDTIGSFTFAKTLEYKAKQGFSGKEVTTIPPHEYQERFVNAMDTYFLACPGALTWHLYVAPANSAHTPQINGRNRSTSKSTNMTTHNFQASYDSGPPRIRRTDFYAMFDIMTVSSSFPVS
jgi:Phosphatidylinositol-4-phosphate 5-Kinase